MQINPTQVRNYLTIRYDPDEKPIFPKAKWQDFIVNQSVLFGKKVNYFLRKSIQQIQTEKNSTLAVSLSGGIDSTLCLGLLRDEFPDHNLIGLCAVFEKGFDESKVARSIAKKFDAKFKIIHIDSIFKNLPELIFITKKPRWNTYQHYVANEAKKFSQILITGDGADELFGGYTFRYNKFQNLLQPKDNWKIKTINYLECHNRDWVPDQEYLFGRKIKFEWQNIFNYFKTYFSNPLHPLQQVMLADFNGKLIFDFIPTAKYIMEYYDLKYKAIFLEPNLINFALHLPINQKYDYKKQKGKLILRKISKKLGIDHIDEKKGFSPDLWFDWEKYGKKIAESYIMNKDSYIFRKNLINHNWVLRAFESVENDGDIRYLNRLIAILALEIWCQIFITKTINKSTKL